METVILTWRPANVVTIALMILVIGCVYYATVGGVRKIVGQA
jgi:hypothetical protein